VLSLVCEGEEVTTEDVASASCFALKNMTHFDLLAIQWRIPSGSQR
jgi:hypothetical protein